jgi:gluconate 2-dehydrogenase alpha chain
VATELKKTDVVIVGLGAAGGVAVLPMAQAGLDVVALEAGTWLAPADFAPDELRNNFRGWPQAVQKANREIPTHRATASSPYSPRLAIHPTMNAVGGTTLHYWAQSWRLNPWDFKVLSETRRRYGASRVPAGSTVEDWPFGIEELEPYYDKVEVEIGVSGQAGNVRGAIDRRGNIFEGPRSRAYPMPPLHGTGFTDMMAGAARSLGWHPFPGPAAITSGRYQGRSACVYHGYCNRGGCHVSAKGSTAVTTIPKAQRTKRLTVVTEAHVTTIAVDAQGRATGVHYLKGSVEYFQPADVVLVAGYVYENVRLLLLSTSRAFPKGLSNNHGQVGRHYFSHNQIATVNALFPRNLNAWYGLPAQGVAVDNWADDNFDHGGLDFIGGGNLWVYSDRRPTSAAGMSTFGRAPRWGSQWKAFVKENADRWNTAYLQKTTLPYEDNYLDLDPTVKDPLGFPVCRITADYKQNERAVADFSQNKMIEWYRAAGAIATEKTPVGTMGPSTHAYGGTRMGHNAETNVVDRWGFSHEVPNLGILGASVMGTSGARNPTLTAQALAWRTGEHLAENWKRIAG